MYEREVRPTREDTVDPPDKLTVQDFTIDFFDGMSDFGGRQPRTLRRRTENRVLRIRLDCHWLTGLDFCARDVRGTDNCR